VAGLRSGEGGAACIVLDVQGDVPVVALRFPVEFARDELGAPFHAAVDEPERADQIIDAAIADADARAGALLAEVRRMVPDLGGIGVVLGNGPAPTRAAALRSHVAMHAAEGALLRTALLDAASETALPVHAVAEREVIAILTRALGFEPGAQLTSMGAPVGRPWRKPEKLAAAVAWLASLDLAETHDELRSDRRP
jgi:hypothetical protein